MKKIFVVALLSLMSCTVFAKVPAHKTKLDKDYHEFKVKANKVLDNLTPAKNSALEQQQRAQRKIANNPLGIIFYKPTYLLPYYYTYSPYHSIYRGQTPENQGVRSAEFKAQLSLKVPLWMHPLHSPLIIYGGYTQLSYWQFYAKSQFFRETNYEPEIFASLHFHRNWLFNVGVEHQSNGRGGALERSWNRTYADLRFAGKHWMVSIKPWLLIFQTESSDLHNPDIAHYLGHERVLFVYKGKRQTISLQMQNLESGMRRGNAVLNWAFPVTKHVNLLLQGFTGYGQSLIEYNHRTNSLGVGISLSNWL